MSIRAVVLFGVLLLFPIVIAAGQWPQFRCPSAGVAADDRTLPKNVVWAQAIPGQSWNSPIVLGDHTCVTPAIKGAFQTLSTLYLVKGAGPLVGAR